MDRPLKVMLACSGLDHAHRGFESFARDCFDELRKDAAVDIELIKGSGPEGPRERSVRSLRRDSRVALALGSLSGRQPFRFEHAAFALSLQPELRRRPPDIVYFSEWHVGLVLAYIRRLTHQRFKLVLSNGTMAAEGFDHLDRVQELTPAAMALVLELGGDPQRHTMLPLGFPISPGFTLPTEEERRALRDRFGLPADQRIVLSLAALNNHHKRLDYLIREVASLPETSRPFVLLAGQPEPETPGIRTLAQELLGPAGHSIRTVPQSEVEDLCRAADDFVLASLGEGLPRALIEAMAAGLPCLTHDYGVTRFALGPHGFFADFSASGGLAGLLANDNLTRGTTEQARHGHVYENFSWERLRPRYVEFLRSAATA